MRFNTVYICLLFLLAACGNASQVAEEKTETIEEQPIQVKQENITVYQIQKDPLIDSLLTPIEEFGVFVNAMEDLTKLNPEGISPFLLGTLIKCNTLLRYPIPAPFNTPEITSRLKVVKTELLKSRYYSLEEQQEELDKSFQALFMAYTAYLKRIEDFSLEEREKDGELIDLTQ